MGGAEIFNLTNHKGKVKRYKFPSYDLSPFLYSFMYAMTYRYSCYECPFARIPRQGDITLADYWGVKEFFPEMDRTNGVSLILLNTDRGRLIFEKVKDCCEIRKSTVADGAKYNGNLVHVSKKSKIRDGIYAQIKDRGYESLACKEFKSPNYKRIVLFSFLQTTPVLKKLWKLAAFVKNKIVK